MTIRAKLFTSMTVQAVLVVIVGIVLAGMLGSINQADRDSQRAARLSEGITEMRFITFESLLRHEERPLEQWRTKYGSLTKQLKALPSDSPQQQRWLALMAEQHQAVKSLFDRLVASYGDASTPPGFQERLAGQLLVKQQAQIVASANFAAESRATVTARQKAFSWLVLLTIVLMLVVTFVNSGLIISGLSASLAKLKAAAAAIANGNLGHRVDEPGKDELGQLAIAFNTMAAGLQQIDRTKSDFILLVSHQLRTPATAVKGFLSLLTEGYLGKLYPRQTEAAKSAYDENERQLRLIDEMLVVAQAETGEMILTMAPVDLGSLLDTVVAAQVPVLRARHQTIRLNRPKRPPRPQGDAAKLRLVIENLITNASQYSANGQNISVLLRTGATEVTIQIEDSGYGIAPADISKLFQKFSRLPSASEAKNEGAGLGLYLAHKIMELHHGHISVISEVGRGSTFAIHLPLMPEA